MNVAHALFHALKDHGAREVFGIPEDFALPLFRVFQMAGWELGNCCRHGWDPIVVVFNNMSWEMLHAFQPESKFTVLDDWHFADIAPTLGGDGVRVRTRRELRNALHRAIDTRGRFQLIEAMFPRGAVSPTLERFVNGVKRLSASPR
jgi:indolepyruvate decarboxylase